MKELILHPAGSSEPSEIWSIFERRLEQVWYHFSERRWRRCEALEGRVVMVSLG